MHSAAQAGPVPTTEPSLCHPQRRLKGLAHSLAGVRRAGQCFGRHRLSNPPPSPAQAPRRGGPASRRDWSQRDGLSDPVAGVAVEQTLAPPPSRGAAPQDAAAAAAAAGAAAPVEARRAVRLASCCGCGKVRGGAARGAGRGREPGTEVWGWRLSDARIWGTLGWRGEPQGERRVWGPRSLVLEGMMERPRSCGGGTSARVCGV